MDFIAPVDTPALVTRCQDPQLRTAEVLHWVAA